MRMHLPWKQNKGCYVPAMRHVMINKNLENTGKGEQRV